MRSQFESEMNFDIFFKIFIFYMKSVQTLRMFHWRRVQTRSLLAFHMQTKRVSRQKIFTWEVTDQSKPMKSEINELISVH